MSENVTSSRGSQHEEECEASAQGNPNPKGLNKFSGLVSREGKVSFGLVEHEKDGVVTPSDGSTEKYRQYELQQALEDEIVNLEIAS